MRAHLTPNAPPTGFRYVALLLPSGGDFLSELVGAISEMTESQNWQKFGNLTEAGAAELWTDVLASLEIGMIGEIFMAAYDAELENPETVMLCDGRDMLATKHPILFSRIGTSFGEPAPGFFSLPDFRGIFPRGMDFIMGETGGANTVALDHTQNGTHAHATTPHAHNAWLAAASVVTVGLEPPVPAAVPTISFTNTANVEILGSGEGAPHENRPPYLAVGFFIRTG